MSNNRTQNSNLNINKDTLDSALNLISYSSMPAKDEAWLFGFTSANSGSNIEDNPFQLGDEEFELWEAGWWDGFYGETYTAQILSNRISQEYSVSEQVVLNEPVIKRGASKDTIPFTQQIKYYIEGHIKPIVISISVLLLGFAGMLSLIID